MTMHRELGTAKDIGAVCRDKVGCLGVVRGEVRAVVRGLGTFAERLQGDRGFLGTEKEAVSDNSD